MFPKRVPIELLCTPFEWLAALVTPQKHPRFANRISESVVSGPKEENYPQCSPPTLEIRYQETPNLVEKSKWISKLYIHPIQEYINHDAPMNSRNHPIFSNHYQRRRTNCNTRLKNVCH